MLRSDVQDKLVEALDEALVLIRKAAAAMVVPKVVISEDGKKAAKEMRDALNASSLSAAPTSPARRMWKVWASIIDHDSNGLANIMALGQQDNFHCDPVTILPGHDAVEQIEREAFDAGFRAGLREAKSE